MTNIFISYSRNDRPVVQHMASALQHDGFNVWWDREIPPGSTFADVIDKRLNEADCVLVIWSSSSVKSNWVQEEADDGLQSGRLIPVMIENIDLPRGFKRLQTADLINWRGDRNAPEWLSIVSEVRRLVAQGRAAAAPKPAAPRPTVPKPAPPRQTKQTAAAPSKRAAPKPEARQAPPRQKSGGGAGLVLGLLAVVIAAIGGGGYFFLNSDAGTKLLAKSETVAPDPTTTGAAEAKIEVADNSVSDSGGDTLETAEPSLAVLTAAESEPAMAEAEDALDETLPDTPAAVDAGPKPGELLQDCESCPELVVIAAGASVMGAPDGERSSETVETPQIEVHLDYSFAIGRYEVTYDQWAACLADGGCSDYQPSDSNWGKGARPVINVSYDNVQDYLAWLATKTGEKYRLPSEAEWEFAARSGTTTPFSTGESISTRQANFNGQYPYAGAVQERSAGKTLAVGSFSPNAFGLYDMQGNVWEWVSDCWRASHREAEASGAPVGGTCAQRVLKGGAWNGGAWRVRVAHRKPAKPSTRDYDTGFRVVREL